MRSDGVRPPLNTHCTCISVSSCRPDKFRRARCAVAEGEVIYPVDSLNWSRSSSRKFVVIAAAEPVLIARQPGVKQRAHQHR